MRSDVNRKVVMRRISVFRYQRLISVCRDSAVGTALGCGRDGPGLETCKGQEIFFSSQHPDNSVTQPASCSVGTGFILVGKMCGRDVNHTPPSGAGVKTEWSYTSISF